MLAIGSAVDCARLELSYATYGPRAQLLFNRRIDRCILSFTSSLAAICTVLVLVNGDYEVWVDRSIEKYCSIPTRCRRAYMTA